MPEIVPSPSPEDIPFNSPYTVDLDDGKKATVTYSPEQSGSTFYVAAVAISKNAGSIYEIRDDGSIMYGPAAIPPTDIDDMTVCWYPCEQFHNTLEVIIRNDSGTAQTYNIQPIGFEEIDGGAQ